MLSLVEKTRNSQVTQATLCLAVESADAKLQIAIHAPIGGVAQRLPYAGTMGETKFLVIRQRDGRVCVEMTKPGGRPRLIPDFRDMSEAEAWIIQTKRLMTFGVPKRP
jgi:hypothetical protein